jgi:Protein of unknown function (DUF3618)
VADTETSLAERDPDALAKEIERTREELARTIDTIADRVNPAKAARRAVGRVRDEASRIDPRLAAAGAVVVVGVAAFLIWRRRR